MSFRMLLAIFGLPWLAVSASAPKGASLAELYGETVPAKAMVPFSRRIQPRSSRSINFGGDYLEHRTPMRCDFPLEIVLLQDVTDSFNDDIANMKNVQLDLMYSTLKETHPGSAYAVVPFGDKPISPLGNSYDWCLTFLSELSTDISVLKADYDKLYSQGGGDAPEAQFTAIVAAAQSNTPGWGVVNAAARLMVVVTDAAPHFEGDGHNPGLAPFSGAFDEENMGEQCRTEYYPTPDTVRRALWNRQTYFGALVYDGSYDYNLPIESWEWLNGFLNQTEGFVHDIDSDASNFWERLALIIAEVEEIECGLSEPTTLTPTTLGPTTPASDEQHTLPKRALTEAPTRPSNRNQESTKSATEEPTRKSCRMTCISCEPCCEKDCCSGGVVVQILDRPDNVHFEFFDDSRTRTA
eukprot:Protomagalhaensia_wolfi_Nauph_80__226@NODE_1125_length_1714_cov_193_306866_g858_i0_p1_GENE_NODE_1125_length_1714_cov_193_306866_g858_i0NODE_1125_length_1714_cov_193_306866_g858_i0_p1_ORF_typecomplete_len410_score39_45Integrin_beta/PF00362_18/9_8e25VWA/PF00092_28/6_8e05VWA_2/PF13519_6/0_0011_NODE_1125_length_1714_cov_193_306866_g858_i01041333